MASNTPPLRDTFRHVSKTPRGIEVHSTLAVAVGVMGELGAPRRANAIGDNGPVIGRDGLRLMAVHAHPDDESSKGAATMAKYADEGVDVLVVTCTGGERGSILNPALQGRPDIAARISQIRQEEMRRACQILRVRQTWLGFVDSGLPEGDPLPPLPEGSFASLPVEVAAKPLIRKIREFRPHVITTYDETGGYPHPDHVMSHRITVAAFTAAAETDSYPELGEPWQPLKLYYDGRWTEERMAAIDAVMLAEGFDAPYREWREEWKQRHERDRKPNITTRIRCAEWFERRDAALIAHATQVDPQGSFFQIPLAIQKAVWPTEDFELVATYVDTTVPEDDLFAGVREKVAS